MPPWLGLTFALVAVAVTILSYLHARRHSPSARLAYVAALRVLAVLLVSILALRPLVTSRREVGLPARFLVLVDSSRSMSLRDYPGLPTRLETVAAALDPQAPHMSALASRVDMDIRPFDSRLLSELPSASLASLSPDGDSTALATSLSAAAASLDPPPAAIMLFSDGIETSPNPPAYAASVPVIAVGAGSKLSADGALKDVSLARVEVLPDGRPVASKDNVTQIAAYVEGLGLPGAVVPIRLTDSNGALLAEEHLTIDSLRSEQPVTLSFTPSQKGNFKYTVQIPLQPDEAISENNSRSLNITVTDPELNVLYIEGTLRWEYRYLKRTLERDPNLRLLALVRLSEHAFYQQGNFTGLDLTGFPPDLDTLKRFNVILIGDLDPSALSPADMDNIRKSVYEGAGLIMLGGYHSFSPAWRDTPVAELLPVSISPAPLAQEKNEFVPRLTPQGELSPIFAGVTDYFPTASARPSRRLPPLLGQVRLSRPKPAATVLAENPLRSDADGPLPVLVVQDFGAGRTAAFAVDTTWRWFAPLKGLGLESPYIRFWGQFIRWIARRDAAPETGQPGVEAWLDKAWYSLGDEALLTARVRAADGLLTDLASVSADVTGPSTLTLPLAPLPGDPGVYSASFKPDSPGDYSASLSATLKGSPLGSASAAFEVGAEDVEMRRLDLDEDHLRSIASASGGLYMPLVDFPSWAASYVSSGRTEKTVELLNLRTKKVLYPLFLIFVVLVTVEWIWRKRLHLP